jgi:VanZ family protein
VTSVKLRKIFITIGITWLCYGVAMEFVQEYCIPNRSFDMGDIIADGTGCLLGVIFSTRRYKKN